MTQLHQPPVGKTLEDMFTRQRLLMENYIALENLPEYPIEDLGTRTNQKLLKSFAYRVIEELGESFEHLQNAFGAISTNHSEEAQQLIDMYNEEIADAWHFLLELMVFSDLNEHSLSQWVARFTYDNPRYDSLLNSHNLLGGFLKYADFKNQEDGKTQIRRDRTMFIIYPDVIASEFPGSMGGRKLSPKVMSDHAEFLWEITFRLTLAMNCLKARDWHTEEKRVVNQIKYNESLMEAFIAMIRFMAYTGKTELSIYNSYVNKNYINWERFKTQ